MTQAIIDFFRELLHNDIATVIVIAMIPIIELRGAIPVALSMGMTAWEAFGWCWLGSVLVSPFLLLLLRPILNWMKRFKPFRALAHAVESVFRGRAEKVVSTDSDFDPSVLERRKMLGVFTFVAIPLPMTGVWTGSAVATFLDLPFWKSLLMVMLGNVVAGAIITLLSYFLQAYVDLVLGVLLGIVVVVLIVYIIMLVLRMRKQKKEASATAVLSDAAAQTDGTEQSADVQADGETQPADASLTEKESEQEPTLAVAHKTTDGADKQESGRE